MFVIGLLSVVGSPGRAGLALDQVGRADGRGEGVGVAGARVRVSRGVGELDHVLIAVVDGMGERVLGRLRQAGGPGRSVRAAGAAGA